MKMQKNNLESDYKILEALKKNPNISQRDLANELGYSLGKVNYLLEALFQRGLVKMDNFIKSNNKIGYMYILTPKGISERAKITKKFLERKIKEHEMIQKEINALREKLVNEKK
jgi:EPS-associated MarR family transcriptional regulator